MPDYMWLINKSFSAQNIQPVISVVPLSPRGLTPTDSVGSSNVSILGNSAKEDSNDHGVMDKDSGTSFKIITKDEVYANLMVGAAPVSDIDSSLLRYPLRRFYSGSRVSPLIIICIYSFLGYYWL